MTDYRDLFREGLQLVMAQDVAGGRLDRLPECMKYLGLLNLPEYKFGQVKVGRVADMPIGLFLTDASQISSGGQV